MSIKLKAISDIAPYAGPNAIPGIRFRAAARELGVTAWGMNVIEIDAGCTGYPEHDHTHDGQEEVYVVLRGSGHVEANSERFEVSVGAMVHVAATTKRKFFPGPSGLTLLAIGGTPGKAYEPRR
jgi:mannose-6-phosphate isomerase-like protein (cupin superfamily)